MNYCCDSPSYGLKLASKPKRKFDNFACDELIDIYDK